MEAEMSWTWLIAWLLQHDMDWGEGNTREGKTDMAAHPCVAWYSVPLCCSGSWTLPVIMMRLENRGESFDVGESLMGIPGWSFSFLCMIDVLLSCWHHLILPWKQTLSLWGSLWIKLIEADSPITWAAPLCRLVYQIEHKRIYHHCHLSVVLFFPFNIFLSFF